KQPPRIPDNEPDRAPGAASPRPPAPPPPIPAAARPILARVHALQDKVKAEQKDVNRLKQLAEKADDDHKLALEEQLQLKSATLEVDQEDLDAAGQELIRAGGDPKNKIQQLMEQHDALGHEQTGIAEASSSAKPVPAQAAESRIFIVQLRAWRQATAKEVALSSALGELPSREAELAREHQEIDKNTQEAAGELPHEHASET